MQTDQGRQCAYPEQLANGLGWFSIGLGLVEVIAPGKVAGFIGIEDRGQTRAAMRCFGLREIAAGCGILSQQKPAAWLWGRVAGDVLDLGSLTSACAYPYSDRQRITAAAVAVAAITALDVYCAQQLSRGKGVPTMAPDNTVRDNHVHVRKTFIVNRSPDEVYRFWHHIENLPAFMTHLESVRITGDGQSHWRVKGPGGTKVGWDAEITEDRPGSVIAWRSLENSTVQTTGSVHFERGPGERGTLVRADIEYAPPLGKFGLGIAKLLGPMLKLQIENDLRRFKQVMETGEVVKSDASIHRGMHPAQPSAKAVRSRGADEAPERTHIQPQEQYS